MIDFFKYLTVGPEDRDWGLFLNAAGRGTILPETEYPLPIHPRGYYFTSVFYLENHVSIGI